MRRLKLKKVYYRSTLGLLVVLFICQTAPVTSALSQAQKNVYNLGINYFDVDSSDNTCSTPGGSNTVSQDGTPGGTYTLDQVKAFLREPINSTWNIPDNMVEQWFLTQDSVTSTALDKHGVIRGVVPRYGLTSSNIHEITDVVRGAGVSPAFFYAYTYTEGGGVGGFVNWKRGIDKPGIENAKSDAERDAKHLAEVASAKPGKYPLAWKDEDHPQYDPVPQDVQTAGNKDFANTTSWPLGTLGRLLIPSTAAAVWEVYYPAALNKSVNGVDNYGPPILAIMKTIAGMGADPMDGGVVLSAGSCTVSVTGTGMAKAISWAKMIADNDGYGYDQITDSDQVMPGDARTTGWVKWNSDPNCTSKCGSFDCSSFVSAALTEAGYFDTNPNFDTKAESSKLEGVGFTDVTNSVDFSTGKGLLPGDILVSPGSHTEIYIGNNQTVGAHQNEKVGSPDRANGGEVGDQNGKEISVVTYENHPWVSAWRAPN